MGRQRHPTFYLADGSVVIELPGDPHGTLYRLPKSLLAMRSGVFKTLFSLPRDNANPTAEGTNDEDPVVLQHMAQEDFERLLIYLFGGHSAKNLTLDFLSSVLKMSLFLEIDDGEEYATTQLPKLPDFTPVIQMHLARLYCVNRWVEPAFRQLIAIPITQIQLIDAQRIDLPFYHILVKTKAKIDHHRRSVAFSAPDAVVDPLCHKSAVCSSSWTMEWWRGLARQLLHPDAALTEMDVLAGFETVMIPGMCDSCQGRSIDWVKASKVFEREEEFVKAGVEEVMALQN